MKKRQIKKNSKTAMLLLMRISQKFYPKNAFAQNFDCWDEETPKGIWEFWYECGGEYNEWDCRTAFEQLHIHIRNEYAEGDVVVIDGDPSWVWIKTPDLSTAKKVFNLAKQLIEQSAGGGV